MWNDVMCHRAGAPPLRFLGTRLGHVEDPHGEPHLFLTLWARRLRDRRDYVVALSERGVGWKANALVAQDIATAVSEVEARCERMRKGQFPLAPGDTAHLSVAELVEARCRTALQERRFREIAAVALDRWLAISGTDAVEHDRMHARAAN